jgi:ATP-binding cassette subfamily B (MDR/TAP) protein 1
MGQEKSSAVMKKSKGSLRSIFMHADGVDICLMALGILGSVGDGFSTPLVLYISSKLMNNIGDASGSLTESFTHSINKVYISPFLFLSHTQTQAKANWVWFCG